MSFSTDIINNDRRSRRWDNAQAARSEILLQGVWETFAERSTTEPHSSFGREPTTPFTVFEDSEAGRERLQLVQSRDTLRMADSSLPNDQRVLISELLDTNAVVALAPGQASDRLAWWRIDPVTGSTIGILPNGRGATVVEYIIVGILVAAFVALSIKSFGECLELYWAEVELCTRGLDAFTVITDAPEPRVEHEKLECYLSQLRYKRRLPEPDCYCGGVGRMGAREPACPDWLPPKKRGERPWF